MYPGEIRRMASDDRQGNDFGDIIRMRGDNRAAKRLNAASGRLDHEQGLWAAFNLPLPPKDRLNSSNDVDAGRQLPAHDMPRESARRRECWACHEYHNELCLLSHANCLL